MIAFLIDELNIRGGTHKQLLKLLEYTEKQKVDFYVLTKKLDFDRTFPGFRNYEDRIFTLPVENSTSFWRRFCLRIKLMYVLRKRLRDADIINIHDCGFELYLPALIGKKVYWQVNDLASYFRAETANDKVSFKERIAKYWVLLFKNVITDFTVNVSKNKARIQRCFHRDAHVFYCGIEPVEIARNIDCSLERFKRGQLQILTSGVFFPYRNYETQIAVVKSLINNGVDVHLDIIGSTALNEKYASHIRNLIQEEGLSEYVTICGQIDEANFKQLHQNADLFMFVNIDQSWGLAVFEAMSCAIPVFVSRSVGATEILSDGVNAIFVDPINSAEISDSIVSLMKDEKRYIQIANKSSEFCNSYSWDSAYSSRMLNLMIVTS